MTVAMPQHVWTKVDHLYINVLYGHVNVHKLSSYNTFCTYGTESLSISRPFLDALDRGTPSMQRNTCGEVLSSEVCTNVVVISSDYIPIHTLLGS